MKRCLAACSLLLFGLLMGCGGSNEVEFAENPIAPPPPDAVQGVGAAVPGGGDGGPAAPGNVATPPPE